MKAQDLKKSILQYAMWGKLVPQNPNDEPASVLLERIKIEKERLIKEGKIKEEKSLPAMTDEEVPYELPIGWEWVRINDICIKITDGEHIKPPLASKGIPLLTAKNILDESIDFTNVDYLDENIAQKSWQRCNPEINDILVCSRGTIGRNTIVQEQSNFCLMGTVILIKLFNKIILPEFVNYVLKSPLMQFNMNTLCGSTAVSALYLKDIKQMALPIPPLVEQKRIVEKLEQILTLIDEYDKNEQKLTTINEKLPSKLRQAILQYAVEGKLVPQNPTDEPASILFERIKAEKEQLIKDGKIKKEKPLPPITKDEIPYALPQDWEWVRTIDISQLNPRNELEDNIKAGFVPMNLISSKYGETHEFETQLWKEIKSGFTHFQDNDVVVAKITPCFQNGKSAIIKNLPNKTGAGTTELHVIRPIFVLPEFLIIHFKSPNFLNTGKQLMTGCAGQQRVSRNYIENYIMGLPSIEEQKRIVAKVNELMKFCDELEKQIKSPKLATKVLEKITEALPVVEKSNVIDITDTINKRAIFRAHIISKFQKDDSFGAIKCEKLTYLPEKILELPLGGIYEKQTAGPLDSEAKHEVEEIFKQLKWVNVIEGNTSQNTRYIPDANFTEHEELFNLCFGDKKSEIDKLLNLFKNKTSTECEAIATLYAVWNDLLIDKKPTSQEDIIEGFFKWSAKKKNFNRQDLYDNLTWMKYHNLIPAGKGNKTIPKSKQLHLLSH